MNKAVLNTALLNCADIGVADMGGVGAFGDGDGGNVKPFIKGHITDGSSTFTFKVNNADVTVPVDANGNWKWVVDRTITSLYRAFYHKVFIDNIVLHKISGVTNCQQMFGLEISDGDSTAKLTMKKISFKQCDFSSCTTIQEMFVRRIGLAYIVGLDKCKLINCSNMQGAFTGVPFSFANFNWQSFFSENTININSLFYGCKELEAVDLSLCKPTQMKYTFAEVKKLETVILPRIYQDNVLRNISLNSTIVNIDCVEDSICGNCNFSQCSKLTEQSVVNIFNAVAADGITLTFHQNVWNMIMREIDVQDSPIQVAYQNMIDNYDVTIANASFDAEIEYLGFSGTQYIDTGFKANTTTTKVETKIQIDSISSYIGLFGSRNTVGIASSDACNVMLMSSGQRIRLDWVNGDTKVLSDSIITTTDYSITITRGLATINGTEFVGTNIDSIDQNYNFLIGNFSNGSSPYTNGFNGKFYWFKIYSNNQLVCDFIPVRKGTTGYLYDKVSGNLFGNSGTGDFILGNDK